MRLSLLLYSCLSYSACSFHLNSQAVRRNPSHVSMGPINAVKSLFGGGSISKTKYDYIIVGGGTAGCVLANRLSADESKKVLVLEAGSHKYKNKYIRIPSGILRLFKTKFDWNFESKPDPSVSNRSIYLARGKVLGGSSALNVLLYHRGASSDYKAWEESCGDSSWSPENVLPYFKKSENYIHGETEYHGVGGEFHVSEVRYQNPLSRNFLIACGEKGFLPNDDFNNWSRTQEGYGRYHVSQKDGSRCSTASGFLEPVLGRRNLKVATEATVSKINTLGNAASGVDVQIDGKNHVVQLAPGGEVILTGGAINSPQLLMLSGIGPARDLKALGIDVVSDVPGVGQNLQDHPAAVVSYECSKGNEGVSVTSAIRVKGTTMPNPKVLLQWLLRKSGPLTSTGCDHGGMFKTDPTAAEPDLQMRFLAARALSPDGMTTFTKFRENVLPDGFSFQSIAVRPLSKGRVTLRSTDPLDNPIIEANYLHDQKDVDVLREGLRLSRSIASSPAFDKYRGEEIYPGKHIQTDAELDDYIRKTLHTSNALVGTCKMGAGYDAVVDANLRVKGFRNLRVADASIMPKIPGGQTSAPTVMIAEKAADIIRGLA